MKYFNTKFYIAHLLTDNKCMCKGRKLEYFIEIILTQQLFIWKHLRMQLNLHVFQTRATNELRQ
jgi:hypothetical protein